MESIFLIVGLGNPGAEYARTRHNAGFLAVEKLAGRCRATWSLEKKFDARIARVEHDGRKLVLVEPQTYMNASGEAVGPLAQYFKVPPARVLIVVDDADLPLGEIRLRERGSPGGHHGLESIEQHLGTPDYPRLRIGIGRRDGARQIKDYVLGAFNAAEWELMEKILDRVADQIECWVADGIQKAMNRFNGAIDGPTKETK